MTPPQNGAAWLDELLGKLSDRPARRAVPATGINFRARPSLGPGIALPAAGRLVRGIRTSNRRFLPISWCSLLPRLWSLADVSQLTDDPVEGIPSGQAA
jgi:hypothetical protein